MSSKDEIISKLSKRLAQERKKRGVNIERLAYEAGISKGNLSDIENGRRDPRYSTLKAIADALDISIASLLKGL